MRLPKYLQPSSPRSFSAFETSLLYDNALLLPSSSSSSSSNTLGKIILNTAQNAIAVQSAPKMQRRMCFHADSSVQVNCPKSKRETIVHPWFATHPNDARMAPKKNASRPWLDEDDDVCVVCIGMMSSLVGAGVVAKASRWYSRGIPT